MIRIRILFLALLCAGLGSLLISLPLLTSRGKDWQEAIVVLAGIELPILICALFEAIPASFRRIPMHIGNKDSVITLPKIQGE